MTVCLSACQFAFNYFLRTISRTLFTKRLEIQIRKIRSKYFNSILYQDIKWFDHIDSKTLSTRIMGINISKLDGTSNMQAGMGSEIGM